MTKTTDVYHEIRELIDDDQTGLMAGFIWQAIGSFAQEVINADPEQLSKATKWFVNRHAWVDCAKQILAKQDDIPF